MYRRLLFIVALGAGAGALAKAGAFLGLLDLEASTTGFLVAVITAAVELLKSYSANIEADDWVRGGSVSVADLKKQADAVTEEVDRGSD